MLLFKRNRSCQAGFLLMALAAGILSLAGAPQQGSQTGPPSMTGSNSLEIELRGPNTQVNDDSLDKIQIFPSYRPFVNFTQSETTVAAHGRDIVVSYNSSADTQLVQISGVVQVTRISRSAFSASHDGGQTWTSGFVPPSTGSTRTIGDGVVVADRHGNFYYSGNGRDADIRLTTTVNKSTDGGRTFGEAVIVQQDDGADKPWIAVGPDPFDDDRDNVYVTWTSFQSTGSQITSSQIRFGHSTDGGQTWSTKTIFAPPPPFQGVGGSMPAVDPVSGRLYVALQQGGFDVAFRPPTDFFRILISDDAGETFHDATFNIPGAPSPAAYPFAPAGEATDCGTGVEGGGLRLTIHSGIDIGGGQFGLRRFIHASRMLSLPVIAARNGIVYMAWNNSDSPNFGDPNSHSNIFFIRSDDGGQSWTSPIQVNPTIAGDIHHVNPALAIDDDAQGVHISYYTQHSDGTVDLDMANSHDRGNSFPAERAVRVTTGSSALAPTNIPLSGFDTMNYDRFFFPACYNLGEYNGLTSVEGNIYAVWADSRKTVTEPINALDPISGQTHPQQDVDFQKLTAHQEE